jgi:maltose alpha-D-glucosyltransferase/alpha-amylase
MTTPAAAGLVTLPWVDWASLFGGPSLRRLEGELLPSFLKRQRWFGGRTRELSRVAITDVARCPGDDAVLTLLRAEYRDGGSEAYLLPLARVRGVEASTILTQAPAAVLARVSEPRGEPGAILLCDGVWAPPLRRALLDLVVGAGTLETRGGRLVGRPGAHLAEMVGDGPDTLADRLVSAEQSNTSIRYGDRLMLKLFRRPGPGENPEREISELLTDRADFPAVARFGGAIDYVRAGQPDTTCAVLQGFVANQGDGWTWLLEEIRGLVADAPAEPQAPAPRSPIASWLDAGATVVAAEAHPSLRAIGRLARRTAELHAALAVPRGLAAFDPEEAGAADLAAMAEAMDGAAARTLDALAAARDQSYLPDSPLVRKVLGGRADIGRVFAAVRGIEGPVVRTRIHGDYHLGQVLRSGDDFVIVDFEGEPARPLAERRAKHTPYRDVAGMLRSLAYVAAAAAGAGTRERDAANRWLAAAGRRFLDDYRDAAAAAGLRLGGEGALAPLLRALLVDKALYELRYELDNRPTWVDIPLQGVLACALEA